MKTLLGVVLLVAGCFTYSFGQVPFDCNGRSYRVLAANDGSYLQEIQQSNSNQTISFRNLHFYPNYEINAIAYHPSQNLIYGVIQTPPYRLCRIDATFDLEILQTLPLSSDLVFVSGDISPDEQHLVLFGFGDTNNENIFALVDVQNGEYNTEVLPIQTSNPSQKYIYCADIAFHPTTGKLFGFDFKNGRLVTLDIANRLIENDVYPISSIAIGNVPSIFFNAKGELFGIGTNLQEMTENRGYYHFDLVTGQPTILDELEIEKNQDACSCPYQIKLLNEVRRRKNSPCTELVFEVTLINKTITEQFDLILRDTFPENVTIKSISPLPFDGIIENSIGNNILTIKDLYFPIGTFSFEIVLDIDENTTLGDYENQAVLTGIRMEDGNLNSILSDDPKTAMPNDETKFYIDALATSLNEEFFGICEGGQTTLNVGIYGANSYEWSSGETTEAIVVHTEGDYQITVTTDCDQTIGTATVTLDEINLELGNNQIIERGEMVSLAPIYTSHTHIKSFSWQTTGSQSLDCPSCQQLIFQPLSDTEVHLVLENGSGCQANDNLFLKVVDVNIYAPNAFSPNNDKQNDAFYLQGNIPYDIDQIQIFDRWGSIIYQRNNIIANQACQGWDGTKNGQNCSAGVYVWTAIIAYKNGQQKTLSGDVLLIR